MPQVPKKQAMLRPLLTLLVPSYAPSAADHAQDED